VLKSGEEITSDIVVVGVGARPNVELLKGQVDLLEEKPGGIKVNGKLQTSNPNIYAVGDVAAFPLHSYGLNKMFRQEHVQNCRESAKHAVSAIFDPSTPDYQYLPYFYSRIFDLGWQFYGTNEDTSHVFFGDATSKKFGTYFVKDGKVVGAFLEGGSNEENAALKKCAQTNPPAPEDLGTQGLEFASKL